MSYNRIMQADITEIKADVYDVWKQAVEYFNNISEALQFAEEIERHRFSDQARNSALSTVNHIAKSSHSRTKSELQNFLKEAMDSLEETVATLLLAKQYRCLRRDLCDEMYFHGALLAKKIKRIDIDLQDMPRISKN